MTWRDKLEIGLAGDASYRRDNLPDFQVEGEQKPSGPGRSPEIPAARAAARRAPSAVSKKRPRPKTSRVAARRRTT